MDEHLEACLECTATLVDMKKVIEHLSDLETVEPTVWMRQKIMVKVGAGSAEKGPV